MEVRAWAVAVNWEEGSEYGIGVALGMDDSSSSSRPTLTWTLKCVRSGR